MSDLTKNLFAACERQPIVASNEIEIAAYMSAGKDSFANVEFTGTAVQVMAFLAMAHPVCTGILTPTEYELIMEIQERCRAALSARNQKPTPLALVMQLAQQNGTI